MAIFCSFLFDFIRENFISPPCSLKYRSSAVWTSYLGIMMSRSLIIKEALGVRFLIVPISLKALFKIELTSYLFLALLHNSSKILPVRLWPNVRLSFIWFDFFTDFSVYLGICLFLCKTYMNYLKALFTPFLELPLTGHRFASSGTGLLLRLTFFYRTSDQPPWPAFFSFFYQ